MKYKTAKVSMFLNTSASYVLLQVNQTNQTQCNLDNKKMHLHKKCFIFLEPLNYLLYDTNEAVQVELKSKNIKTVIDKRPKDTFIKCKI